MSTPVLTGLDEAIEVLQDRLVALRKKVDPRRRIIVAFAGAPGSGKSTITAGMLAGLQKTGISDVGVIPMDGFHLPKSKLAEMEDPVEAFRRRGAPFTFDAEAFVQAVRQLRDVPVTEHDVPKLTIWLPSFDHAVQDPVQDDIPVSSTLRVLVVEGNYTLFDQAPWSEIATLADDKWFVDIPREVAKQRLAKRHLLARIETTQEAAEHRAEENDLPNGDLIRQHLIKPDVLIQV